MDRETQQAVNLITAIMEEMLDGDKVKLLTGQWNEATEAPELTALGGELSEAVAVIRAKLGGNRERV